jgi:hypothetical protein
LDFAQWHIPFYPTNTITACRSNIAIVVEFNVHVVSQFHAKLYVYDLFDDDMLFSYSSHVWYFTEYTPACGEGVHYIPHATDCSKFWHCAHGKPVPKACGPGTVFNSDFNVCVWKDGPRDICTTGIYVIYCSNLVH